MIYVTLGTQDKTFERLLEAVERAIDAGAIREEVIVQAGFTKYESSKMRVVDYLSQEEFNQVIKDASYVITHGGAGTIMTCLKMNKKILAAARLASYHEHVNDHQTQLLSSFEDMGYLIYMKELDDITPYIEQIQTFEPKQYQSNTANMISLIEQFIDNL